jgi:hypothetical protein
MHARSHAHMRSCTRIDRPQYQRTILNFLLTLVIPKINALPNEYPLLTFPLDRPRKEKTYHHCAWKIRKCSVGGCESGGGSVCTYACVRVPGGVYLSLSLSPCVSKNYSHIEKSHSDSPTRCARPHSHITHQSSRARPAEFLKGRKNDNLEKTNIYDRTNLGFFRERAAEGLSFSAADEKKIFLNQIILTMNTTSERVKRIIMCVSTVKRRRMGPVPIAHHTHARQRDFQQKKRKCAPNCNLCALVEYLENSLTFWSKEFQPFWDRILRELWSRSVRIQSQNVICRNVWGLRAM